MHLHARRKDGARLRQAGEKTAPLRRRQDCAARRAVRRHGVQRWACLVLHRREPSPIAPHRPSS